MIAKINFESKAIDSSAVHPSCNASAYIVSPIDFQLPLIAGSVLGISVVALFVFFSKVNAANDSELVISDSELVVSDSELVVNNSELVVNDSELVVSDSELVVNDSELVVNDSELATNLSFYDWNDIASEASGVLIIGNSGSTKTSAAYWLAGHLTKEKPAQLLALDPHANRNPLWEELGIKVLSDFRSIERQMELLEELLDQRRGRYYQPKDNDFLIVITDELGACIKNFDKPNQVERILERIGSEGRKYDIMLIGMNQSSNVDDIGISAQNRNNFVLVLCGTAARNFAELKWKATDKRQKWVNSQAYPCVLSGAVQNVVAGTRNDVNLIESLGPLVNLVGILTFFPDPRSATF